MPSLVDVLFSEVRADGKSFRRLLAVGGLFAFVGHFYVVEPYFRYKNEEILVHSRIEAAQAEIEILGQRLARMSEVQSGAEETLAGIHTRIAAYPDQLRTALGDINRIVHDGTGDAAGELWQQQAVQQQATGPRLSDGTVLDPVPGSLEEGARWYVNRWFGSLIDDLREGVVEPVLELQSETDSTRARELASAAGEAERSFTLWVQAINPDFWREYETKVGVAGQVMDKLDELFAPLLEDIRVVLKSAEDRNKSLEASLAGAQQELEGIEDSRETLESRLSSLESPLGRIPVGLVDLIELFPLLTLVWVATLAGSVGRLHRNQVAFRAELAGTESGDAARKRYEELTGHWFLPLERSGARRIALVAVLLPGLVVAGRSALLVVRDAQHIIANSDVGMIREGTLQAVYVAGLLVVVALALRTWRRIG